MEGGEMCGKSVSEEVKPEWEEGEVLMQGEGGGGGDGGAATAAGEAMAPVQIDVRMDVALLHCQACLLPLKPPVFKEYIYLLATVMEVEDLRFLSQCEAAGHVVCCFCRAGHAALCSRAGTHCGELDAVLGAAKVPCPYKVFGCERYVVYHGAADHQRACQCAPCSCPEPGCVFVGSRAMLLDHFAAGHQRHAVTVRYGRPWNLGFSLSRRWHVLVGEDRSVFLVSLGPLGAATAVSLVCVRPDGAGEAAPQFRCKLSVERPAGDDKDNLVLMTSAVSSSALSTGAPAPGQGMFLAVPQELLSGDTLMLSVRIDLIRPAGGAPKSATPQARTPRRMQ
ncbi:E3 ubiquitin-protein ligase SINA-like 4 isoform X1 [Triticum aestivum]|uniref:E3 ubiquitin-protein ligase SINA-like 4 isoform X1 n=1 Tax=Triticum aestivum TaxID=4565 RepID=UPI001D013BBE|nr:E3 ubiquitin-protein ligase SINA-like 4 isoform X1 [Triticum aestivum]